MPNHSSPRLLVAEDDLGVVAAYRHVLEGDWNRRPSMGLRRAELLEDELFGTPDREGGADMDWRVHFVHQGEDAVASVREAANESDPFAVVFLDIRMPPGLDGYETAKRIRQIDPNVHIVFVSAYSDYTEEELTAVAGPKHRVSFLPKPVWPDQLRATALGHCREVQMLALFRHAHRKRLLRRAAAR